MPAACALALPRRPTRARTDRVRGRVVPLPVARRGGAARCRPRGAARRDRRDRRAERRREEHARLAPSLLRGALGRTDPRRAVGTSRTSTRQRGDGRPRSCRSIRRFSGAPSPTTSASATRPPTTTASAVPPSSQARTSSSRGCRRATRPSSGTAAGRSPPARDGRLALARAFLRDAPLVVLDEPTADLDPASAAVIAEAIERLRAGRTVVLVAHRPSSSRVADRDRRISSAAAVLERRWRRHDATIRRLLALAELPLGRVVLAIALGASAVGFGVALMATAGYLISRAAEQPPILALTTIIVVVRFLALARPLARYLERLASHDLALRALGRIRATLLRADRAARARGARGVPARRPRQPHGRRRRRAPGALPARRRTRLRRSRRRGRLHRRDRTRPSGGGDRARASGSRLRAAPSRSRRAPRTGHRPSAGGRPRRAHGRARRAAPGRAGARRVRSRGGRPRTGTRRRIASSCASVGAMRSSRVSPTPSRSSSPASRRWASCAVAVAAHDAGILDRVLVAALALLALSSFDAVSPLPAAARELAATLASGRRVLELTDREPAVTDPSSPAPGTASAGHGGARRRHRRATRMRRHRRSRPSI